MATPSPFCKQRPCLRRLCMATALAPLEPCFWRQELLAGLVRSVGFDGGLRRHTYATTVSGHSKVNTGAGTIARELLDLANEVANRVTGTASKHVSICSGAYVSLAASVFWRSEDGSDSSYDLRAPHHSAIEQHCIPTLDAVSQLRDSEGARLAIAEHSASNDALLGKKNSVSVSTPLWWWMSKKRLR